MSLRIDAAMCCFYSTYKELKPVKESCKFWEKEGFYSTYKELKRIDFIYEGIFTLSFLQYL